MESLVADIKKTQAKILAKIARYDETYFSKVKPLRQHLEKMDAMLKVLEEEYK